MRDVIEFRGNLFNKSDVINGYWFNGQYNQLTHYCATLSFIPIYGNKTYFVNKINSIHIFVKDYNLRNILDINYATSLSSFIQIDKYSDDDILSFKILNGSIYYGIIST